MDVTDDGVPPEVLIGIIKSAIARAGMPTVPGDGLRVASAQVTLQVVASKSGGGRLSFCVPFLGARVGAGGTVTGQTAHAIDMTLLPREQALTPAAVGADEVEDVLVSAIATIRGTMAAAAGGDDPWVLSGATVDICFGVTKSGSISLGLDGRLESAATNTLRLILVSH